MEESEKRIKRLENVLKRIELCERYEDSFDELYNLLYEEYRLEGGSTAEYHMGNYNHNLSQTINKQAHSYKQAKKQRPVKGAPYEYRSFVSNFKQDVSDELSKFKYMLNNP